MDVIETVREENPLGKKKVGKLLAEFAIPSIIAMVVSSLYNMVDQIFIGQGVGYLGNAATNVSFPLVTICMSLTLSIGIGSATQFSLSLGRKQEKEAEKVAGSAIFGAIRKKHNKAMTMQMMSITMFLFLSVIVIPSFITFLNIRRIFPCSFRALLYTFRSLRCSSHS